MPPSGGGGGNTYGVGESLPNFPSGFFTPGRVSSASFSYSGGRAVLSFNNGGIIALQDGTTYTCIASGGCGVEDGRVTSGTIRVTTGSSSGGSGGGGSGGSPDLVVDSPSVSDNTLTTGQSFTLRARVRNDGTGSSAATTLRYYQSSNSTISTSDTEVGTDSVNGLSASGTSAESISLNAPSSAGTYYYGACVNSVTGESDTGNNCSSGVSVTVTSASSSQAWKLYWADGNRGIQRSNLDGSGIEDVITTRLGNLSDIALDVSGGKMYWVESDLDSDWDRIRRSNLDGSGVEDLVTTGLSWPYAIAVGLVPVEVGPDLVVTTSVNDNTLTTGQSFTLRATVRNKGTDQAAATTLRYYRSSNATISTDDMEVGTDNLSSLPAGDTSAESISLTAPSSAGTYYYGACVESVSGESNTGNNCSSGVRVTVISSSGGGGGTPPPSSAVTGSITECSGRRNSVGSVSVTIRGTIQAHKSVSNLLITGYANGQTVGVDGPYGMSAGQSKNFLVWGLIHTGASTLSCSVQWSGTVHGKNSQGVVDER